MLEFTSSGSGLFECPRYDVRRASEDLYLEDEGVGALTARLGVRNSTLSVELEPPLPASPCRAPGAWRSRRRRTPR